MPTFDENKFISSAKMELVNYNVKDDAIVLQNALKSFQQYKRKRIRASIVVRALIQFLSSWNMARYGNINAKSEKWLIKNIRSIDNNLSELGPINRLEHFNLRDFHNQKIIINSFNRIANNLNKKRTQYTAAAKILFILRPELFPMWDDGIRKKLGVAPNAEGYYNFMWRTQNILINREVQHCLKGKKYKLRAIDSCLWNRYRTSISK